MKFASLMILLVLLLAAGCKKKDSDPASPLEDPKEDPKTEYELITSVVVGETGGNIISGDLSILISPNGSSNKIDLYAAGKQPDVPNTVTKLYKMQCSPNPVNISSIKIKYSGTLNADSYIVWQEDSYIASRGKMSSALMMIPAKDSTGYLVADLSGIARASLNKFNSTGETPSSGYFYGKTGQITLNSPAGHFKLHFPVPNLTEAQSLAVYLETAYSKLEAMGFNFVGRDWPAYVYLEKFDGWYNSMFFDPSAYGYYVTTTRNPLYLAWRTNNCALYFNLNMMKNPVEMKATAGHEFFHAVQDLYDLRNLTEKRWSASPQAWLDEAASTWFEGELSSNPQTYVPSILSGKETAFTEGLHVDGSKVQDHGYGMSALIKYVVKQKGQSALSLIYDKITLGAHPVAALSSIMNGDGSISMDWYEDYLRELILGNLYGIPSTTFFGNIASVSRYESRGLSDTLCTFPALSYPDLSAQMYQIYLNYPEILNTQASIRFKTSSPESKIMLFKYGSSNSLIKSGDATGQIDLTSQELKSALSGSAQLRILALVINTGFVSSYLGSRNISLQVNINYKGGALMTLQPSYWEGRVNETKMFSLNISNSPAKVRYDWQWGDGASESTTGPYAAHAYNAPGIYPVSVDLFDIEANSVAATAKATAKVSNNPAKILPDMTEGEPNISYLWTVTMDFALSDARYEWDFGDNTGRVVNYSNTATHAYSAAGNYQITVNIFDNSRNLKVDEAHAEIRIMEISPLLAELRKSKQLGIDASPIKLSDAQGKIKTVYLTGSYADIQWTGLNTFEGKTEKASNGTKTTVTVKGSVSLDGKTLNLDYESSEIGVNPDISWYLDRLQISAKNVPLSNSTDWDACAQYELRNSTDFTARLDIAAVTGNHDVSTYSKSESSTIKLKFYK